MPPQRLRAGPHTLAVEVDGPRGAGEPRGDVLLLHGFPDDASIWRPQIEALTAAGFRCIAPHMLGYSPSDAPADAAAYQVGAVADGLASMLVEGMGVERAAVVGHDWGAAVAWQLALRHPRRVSRLAAVSVGHPGAGAAAGGIEQRKRWWYLFLFSDPRAAAWVRADGWALLRELLAAAGGAGADAAVQGDYTARLSQRGALESALRWYQANLRPAAIAATRLAAAPLLRLPVLGVYPARDGALTEAQMAASGRFVAPGLWAYARIEGSGHWPQRDAPGALNAALLGFLLERGSGGGGGGGGGGDGAHSRL
ncbi:alpha beta hydrolase [Raphidocelis subcapitata]|uniref:Alpha beta hydrolase n=1 Tax=Raphidocelis subcapitata TaxID=307507 RepID=A0A2V0P8D2_9CHLO|nr:alpha beta hydrolase [Raphidocelis subcapitata]|eukprot:GBF96106.1 alpha beta hydrolase [Raphidocelis subcapitata]